MAHHTHTRTNALLEISASAYDEIENLLRAAGYDHCFGAHDEGIDMAGIALTRAPLPEVRAAAVTPPCCASSHEPRDTACRGFLAGDNGRCVYCDHEQKCHPGPGATCEIGSGEGPAVTDARVCDRCFGPLDVTGECANLTCFEDYQFGQAQPGGHGGQDG